MSMNFVLRQIMRVGFVLLNQLIQLENFVTRKMALRRWKRTVITLEGPTGYESQVERLEECFRKMKDPWWVTTSGTSDRPKRIPYNKKRITQLNRTFLKSMVTLTSHIADVKTFFAFGSLDKDSSLTASMVSEVRQPFHIELLQAPYRYLLTEEGKELVGLVGELSARVAIILITCPRILYATNPSTITHFIEEILKHWPLIRYKLGKLLEQDILLNNCLKLQDGDGKERLNSTIKNDELNLHLVFPKVRAIVTWDGGYVKPFVEKLQRLMPNVELIPMYSMSTETIETVPHRIGGEVVYLPVSRDHSFEFQDEQGALLMPHELKQGKDYTLIVTDKWGLQRYDTCDVFHVKDLVEGFPDLRFKRRRNVTSSLCGEKITEEQALLLFKKLKENVTPLQSSSLCLFSTVTSKEVRYELAILGGDLVEEDSLSRVAEAYLRELNPEYSSKVLSGRLSGLRARRYTLHELASLMGKDHLVQSQFKVVPLYEKPVRKNS